MDLRIVILDCPYRTWDQEETRSLFCDIASLRFNGYRESYRDGILALNDSDFVATHKLICEEKNGKLIPLLGNASITVKRARFHNLIFPALSLVSNSKDHLAEMQSIVERCENEGRTLAYDGGYVINPVIHSNRETSVTLHRMFQGMKVHFLKEYNIQESITAATVRFKVEKICTFWGYKAMEKSGQRLGDLGVPRYDNELVTVMHMKELDSKAILAADNYKKIWENRIIIGADEIQDLKVAA